MKKLLLVTVACAATAVAALGQDVSLNFNTGTAGIKVYDMDGNPVTGPQYVGQLSWGTAADALAPLGSPVAFYSGGLSSRKGTVNGGPLAVGAGNDDIAGFFQVLVWDSTAGADLASAKAAGGQFGMSEVLPLTATAIPKPPADLAGLGDITLMTDVIPEPSTFALGLIGIGALMLRRRK